MRGRGEVWPEGADLCDDEDGCDAVPFFRALQEDDWLPQDCFDLTVIMGHVPVRWRRYTREHEVSLLGQGDTSTPTDIPHSGRWPR